MKSLYEVDGKEYTIEITNDGEMALTYPEGDVVFLPNGCSIDVHANCLRINGVDVVMEKDNPQLEAMLCDSQNTIRSNVSVGVGVLSQTVSGGKVVNKF